MDRLTFLEKRAQAGTPLPETDIRELVRLARAAQDYINGNEGAFFDMENTLTAIQSREPHKKSK